MKIAIAGAAGRMGRTLTRIASETSGIEIAGGLESSGSPQVGSDMGELAGIGKLRVKVSSDPAPESWTTRKGTASGASRCHY